MGRSARLPSTIKTIRLKDYVIEQIESNPKYGSVGNYLRLKLRRDKEIKLIDEYKEDKK